MAMTIQSDAFEDGKPIPKEYTGEGPEHSPPLTWSGVPAEAVELALIVDDPDAPRPEPWVHWLMYKITPDCTGLPEGVPSAERLDEPLGALQGRNTAGHIGYQGPMPPPGHGIHRYYFKLYALDVPLDLRPGVTKDSLLKAMRNHIIGQAECVGTYERKK